MRFGMTQYLLDITLDTFVADRCLKSINSLRPSGVYMRQKNKPSLVQIMACGLFSAKPLSEPMLSYCLLDPKEHFSAKFYLEFKSFIHKNVCENVCEMAAILSRPQCVKSKCLCCMGNIYLDLILPQTYGTPLLTWFNLNPSMEKLSHPL